MPVLRKPELRLEAEIMKLTMSDETRAHREFKTIGESSRTILPCVNLSIPTGS